MAIVAQRWANDGLRVVRFSRDDHDTWELGVNSRIIYLDSAEARQLCEFLAEQLGLTLAPAEPEEPDVISIRSVLL
jgi:hypothetical protein